MAVAASSITPADGDVNVWPNVPVSCVLTDSVDLDPDLVEVVVNSVSCTLTNGLLFCEPQGDIYLGAVIEDYKALDVATLAEWYTTQGATITATIRYDSGDIDEVEFDVVPPEGFEAGGDATFEAWATDPEDRSGALADVEWEVIEVYHGSSYDVQFMIEELLRHVGGDAYWYCGTRYFDRQQGSGLVGALELIRWQASGLVEGWRLDRYHASGVAQGWKILRSKAQGVVAVQFFYRHQASALVGVETLRRIAASGVVYGVNRNNVLEVHVMSAETYDALIAAGVTWS